MVAPTARIFRPFRTIIQTRFDRPTRKYYLDCLAALERPGSFAVGGEDHPAELRLCGDPGDIFSSALIFFVSFLYQDKKEKTLGMKNQ